MQLECVVVCVCVMGSHGCDECQPARSSTPTQDHSIVGRVMQEFTCTLYHMLYGSNCATVIHPLCVVCVWSKTNCVLATCATNEWNNAFLCT